jgi:hypothetical protein
MKRLVLMMVALAWALWFGGMMALFLFVQVLFGTRHDIAPAAASALFLAFQRYQLILAAVALLMTFAWRWKSPSRASAGVFALLAGATVVAVVLAGWLTPRMEAIRLAGASKGPEFGRLHGLSMGLFLLEAAFLLAAGAILGWRATRPKDALPKQNDQKQILQAS